MDLENLFRAKRKNMTKINKINMFLILSRRKIERIIVFINIQDFPIGNNSQI
jgi:hypothetical protein